MFGSVTAIAIADFVFNIFAIGLMIYIAWFLIKSD